MTIWCVLVIANLSIAKARVKTENRQCVDYLRGRPALQGTAMDQGEELTRAIIAGARERGESIDQAYERFLMRSATAIGNEPISPAYSHSNVIPYRTFKRKAMSMVIRRLPSSKRP